jgi:predicted esterase
MAVGDWDNHVPRDIYWETYPSTDPARNPDLLLVQAIIQEAVRAYGVDARRVYTLGHSNGGFFSLLAATALPDRIAAFAANSAGLVRCATTGGCSFKGSGTTCAALANQAGWCACTGAEKPGPLVTSGRQPPGYLTHSADDTAVSVYYSCALASRLSALGYRHEITIAQGNGHSMPYNLALDAWGFLSQHALP